MYKALKMLKYLILVKVHTKWSALVFWLNGVKFNSFVTQGVPYVHVSLDAICIFGKRLTMNNGVIFSNSGGNGKCRIEVRQGAVLLIGEDVGMSDVTITCHNKITIGNNVLLGVGAQIRDTDNHSLNPQDWINGKDWENKKTAPIIIGNNVFIGAYSHILKGVSIGNNSVVGAGSVVTKNIPAREIWAGNPAKYIKKMEDE
ncbi:acyltransferase [Pontibacter burrus]|uniref:acyltransferase n=1 Tax=Pontibacter burrus TaxID=2704466 RepID=UPI001953DF98|nr:acyltransferase [Pontibacter burrus]